MNGESETTTAFGLRGTTGWFVGGALGGAIGAVAFGIVMVLLEPGVLEAAIPAIYGLEPAGPLGWGSTSPGIVLGCSSACSDTHCSASSSEPSSPQSSISAIGIRHLL